MDVVDVAHQSTLPPNIVLNNRKKIFAEKISTSEILPKEGKKESHQLVCYPITPPPEPLPRYPIDITWSPNVLCLTLDVKPVVAKLWIWNLCKRPIYIHCCGLWDETVRLGVSWCCYPRTRFWLSPGLKAEVFIRATPQHDLSPVPFATTSLQIAAEHMRDNVTAYFSVPIAVKFINFVDTATADEVS